MKKIKVPVPYAKMAVAGLLDYLPNIQGEFFKDEIIFIYAEGIAWLYDKEHSLHDTKVIISSEGIYKQMLFGFDYSRGFDRRIYNEVFFGNIREPLQSETGFIGYASVSDDQYACKKTPLRIKDAHRFSNVIHHFGTSFTQLQAEKSYCTRPKRMYLLRDMLVVPICKDRFNSLNRNTKFVALFWEEYMAEIFGDLSTRRHSISTVLFVCHKEIWNFDIRQIKCDYGYVYGDIKRKREILSIDLKSESGTYSTNERLWEDFYKRPAKRLSASNQKDTESPKREPILKGKPKYIDAATGLEVYSEEDFLPKGRKPRIIYTPMGGKSKWR